MSNADIFSPEHWELSGDPTPVVGDSNPKARARSRQDKFIKGPVPWEWVRQAIRIPGKSLAVGLMLWQEVGFARSRTVRFCLSRAVADGVPIATARRAIRQLEQAGLIAVRRKPGHGLEVTILDPESK